MLAAADAIAGHLAAGRAPVYLHCSEGVGRSVAVAIGFLVQSSAELSVRSALARVQAMREWACPSPGYIEALLGLESNSNRDQEFDFDPAARPLPSLPSVSMAEYRRYYSSPYPAGHPSQPKAAAAVGGTFEAWMAWVESQPPAPRPPPRPSLGISA